MSGAPILDCTGVVIAGGRATRMGGAAKGLLRVGGEPIVARSLALFGRIFGGALVVANDPEPYEALGARVVPDLLPGRGAPGGLHAALSVATTAWVFAAGCDMPFLDEAAIRFLSERRDGTTSAVLVRFGERLEPLHAFYSRACLPALERLLRDGEPSLRELAHAVNARVVEEAEWRAVDRAGRSLENVNTPEDAARLGLEAAAAPPPVSKPRLTS